MDVDDFNGRVVFEVLAKLGDVDVHRTGIEVVVVNPNCFECKVTFKNFVDVSAKKAKEFGLFGGEFRHSKTNTHG